MSDKQVILELVNCLPKDVSFNDFLNVPNLRLLTP